MCKKADKQNKDKNDVKYKPSYGNKVFISILIIIELGFMICLIFSQPFQDFLTTCLSLEIPKDVDNKRRFLLILKQINPLQIALMTLLFISFFISLTALFIIMIKDDGNIRYAKLNELRKISEEIKEFKDKLDTETKVKESITRPLGNQTITNTTETTHTNYLYEFYKKYMDILAEI